MFNLILTWFILLFTSMLACDPSVPRPGHNSESATISSLSKVPHAVLDSQVLEIVRRLRERFPNCSAIWITVTSRLLPIVCELSITSFTFRLQLTRTAMALLSILLKLTCKVIDCWYALSSPQICNIGVGQEWQNTIPEGLTSIHLDLGE